MNKQEASLIEKIWGLTQKNSKTLTKMGNHVAVLNKEMGNVQEDIKDIKDTHATELEEIKGEQEGYTTKVEFNPVKRIVYGAVGIILVAVLGALLALVVRK